MCWWKRGSRAEVPADRKCIVNGATIPDDSGTCEAANCCFDYKKNTVLQTTMITILLSRLQLSFPSKGERKTKFVFPIYF